MSKTTLTDLFVVAGDTFQHSTTRWLAYNLLKREAGTSHEAWKVLRLYRNTHPLGILRKNKR